jgi:DnaK suppressor protein
MLPEALSNSQISELSEKLKTMQAELQLQLNQSVQDTQPVTLDQQSVGRVSRIDAIQQQQMAVANHQQSAVLLKQVLAALRRIDVDEYGFCLHCGEPISFARLGVQPFAPNCLDCQSALEK